MKNILTVAAFWLASTAAVFAQDAAPITLTLDAAQIAEISRLIDTQPIGKSPPAAYWDLQVRISDTLKADPDALKAVLAARRIAR